MNLWFGALKVSYYLRSLVATGTVVVKIIMTLVYLIKPLDVTCDFMGRSPSRHLTILKSLVAMFILLAEFTLSCDLARQRKQRLM